jgi:hypothetical protein
MTRMSSPAEVILRLFLIRVWYYPMKTTFEHFLRKILIEVVELLPESTLCLGSEKVMSWWPQLTLK